MAYGDYRGPDKPDKGQESGSCNRSLCQASPAIWYNHGSFSWYCSDCRREIENDSFNYAHWMRDFFPHLGHPMFETREMMNHRGAGSPMNDEHVSRKAAETMRIDIANEQQISRQRRRAKARSRLKMGI